MSAASQMKRDVWSITRLTSRIRDNLQTDPSLQNVWVEGEIFNLTYHSSGHIYFSLKDSGSNISCTFFKNANVRMRGLRLAEGMKVLAQGNVSVYIPRGSYQLNIAQVILAGEGELRMRIEQLKKKLHEEGLFASARKKPLPYLPTTLGVATAPTGAAIQDIIRVARARHPGINILLAPCLVQGDGAVESVIAAIEALNDPELEVDVIIAGRGGGSFEDLMAFNEEATVRAFASSRVPIISAVGHEIDSPLSDLAADAFAPTPSAAAERAVPVLDDILERIEECGLRLEISLRNRHRAGKERLERILKSRAHVKPASVLEPLAQGLDLIWRDFKQHMRDKLHAGNQELQEFKNLPALYEKNLARFGKRYALASERLNNFSPLATLRRGFAVVRDENKIVIRRSAQVKQGDRLEVLLGEGKLSVSVDAVHEQW